MQVSRFLTKWAYFSKFYCVSNGKQYKFLSVLRKSLQFETLIVPRDVLQGKTEMEDIQPMSRLPINEFSESIFEKEYLIKGF